jgi:hypothetical protein
MLQHHVKSHGHEIVLGSAAGGYQNHRAGFEQAIGFAGRHSLEHEILL